jgi:hypothetical protein
VNLISLCQSSNAASTPELELEDVFFFGLGGVRAVRTFTLTVSCLFALKQSHDCANSSALKSIPSMLDTSGRWSICGLGREELQVGFCVREMVFTRTLTFDYR